MNYEKKYKEALEKARQLCVYPTTKPFISDLQDLFPELKESKDERIRKLCEVLVRTCFMNELCTKEDKNDCIAWLEKQGEPQVRTNIEWVNAIDNACNERYTEEYSHGEYCHEQSFKWGFQEGVEWLKKRGEQKIADKYNITGIKSKHAEGKLGEMIKEMESANKVEPKFKVGDWFVSNINKDVFLIKSVNNGYCALEDIKGRIFSPCLPPTEDNYHLWNIQDAKDGDVLSYRDGQWIFILKRIIDKDSFEYYTRWSTIHNELTINDSAFSLLINSIYPATKEQRDLLFQKMKESGYEWDTDKKELKKIEQKPIDKIEPKFKVGDIISDGFSEVKIISIEKNNYIVTNDEIKNDAHICNWVVYFKDQDNWKLVEQKSTWSEEDEEVLNLIIARLHSHPNVDLEEYGKEYNWLNYNLKSLRPQKRWKPSDEQIASITCAVRKMKESACYDSELVSLFNDLKKL